MGTLRGVWRHTGPKYFEIQTLGIENNHGKIIGFQKCQKLTKNEWLSYRAKVLGNFDIGS